MIGKLHEMIPRLNLKSWEITSTMPLETGIKEDEEFVVKNWQKKFNQLKGMRFQGWRRSSTGLPSWWKRGWRYEILIKAATFCFQTSGKFYVLHSTAMQIINFSTTVQVSWYLRSEKIQENDQIYIKVYMPFIWNLFMRCLWLEMIREGVRKITKIWEK